MELFVSLLVLSAVGAVWYLGTKWQREEEKRKRDEQLGEFFEKLNKERTQRAEHRMGGTGTGTMRPGGAAEHQYGTAGAGATAVTEDEAGLDAAFPVRHPADLPDFSDVGGMEPLKQELRDTVGLLLEHADHAEAYGITWNGILLHGPPGVGKTFLARAVAGEFGLALLHVSTGDLVKALVGESARNVQRAFAVAVANQPCLLFFDEFDSIAQRRDEGTHPEERRTINQLLTSLEEHRPLRGLIVVAATNDLDHLDPAVVRPGRFDRHVRIDLPDREARAAIFRSHLNGRPAKTSVDVDDLARRSDGLSAAAIAQVVDAAALTAFREAAGSGELVEIQHDHLSAALRDRGGEDRPTVEDWDWDSLVLQPEVKAELQQLQALIEDPDLAQRFGVDAPTGVLLAGPPGTGKTTIAKVLAAQARCSFYPVSAADVTSKWAGESERSIQRLFERARTNRPSIVFIDEIDAIGARRGASEEWASRQLNQLLQEMDGLTGTGGVMVIGATNRPELLDPALVRGGRLSRTITIPTPDIAGRRQILALLTARMPTVGCDLDDLARGTGGMSGADLKAVCQQAALHALVRARGEGQVEPTPAIHHDDFVRAIADRRSSEAANRG